jgi:hypothetical protein
MNELKATKGEWKVNLLFVESAGRMIADCGISNYGGQEEEEANVNLIAQSKKMYAMLEELIRLGTGLLSVDEITDEEDAATVHSNFNDQVIIAEVLLAKCRGE